ncbi:MAG: tyrosine-type recombinase/integrase [Bacteroidia bacterium]
MQTLPNLSVLFWLKQNKKTAAGTPIYCRITIYGQRTEISMQRYVNPDAWLNGQLVGKTKEEKEINHYLSTIRSLTHRHFEKLVELGNPISAEILKNKILGIEEKKMTFNEAFDWMMKEFSEKVEKGKRSQNTLNRLDIAKEKWICFLKENKKVSDIPLDQIQSSFVYDFEHFLSTVHDLQSNTLMKYIKIAKQVLSFAVHKGKLSSNPFNTFKCTYDEPEIDILEMHELITMWQTPMPDKDIEEIRDIYIFSCYTGYAFSDAMSLEEANIFVSINNERWIRKDRTKTDTNETVMLLDIPLEIIAKYKNHKCQLSKGKLLPQQYNSRFNKYIKIIAALCGIKKHLTHHTARHTFATTVTLENNVPIEDVSKMLGHKSIRTTQRYAKVSKRKIYGNMVILRDKLKPVTVLKTGT